MFRVEVQQERWKTANCITRNLKIVLFAKSGRMRLTGHVARMGRSWMHIGFLWESQKESRIGSPRRTLEDNIKMNFSEIECSGIDWIHAVQDRDQWRAVVNTVVNLWFSWNVGKFLSNRATGGFGRIWLHGVKQETIKKQFLRNVGGLNTGLHGVTCWKVVPYSPLWEPQGQLSLYRLRIFLRSAPEFLLFKLN
jgi:hypothetical protein